MLCYNDIDKCSYRMISGILKQLYRKFMIDMILFGRTASQRSWYGREAEWFILVKFFCNWLKIMRDFYGLLSEDPMAAAGGRN